MARPFSDRPATRPASLDSGRPRRPGRRRHHHSALRQLDRRALERVGWRTTLDFRENHSRLDDGRLVDVEPMWVAEAERDGVVIGVVARSESRAWSQLRVMARQNAEDFSSAASA